VRRPQGREAKQPDRSLDRGVIAQFKNPPRVDRRASSGRLVERKGIMSALFSRRKGPRFYQTLASKQAFCSEVQSGSQACLELTNTSVIPSEVEESAFICLPQAGFSTTQDRPRTDALAALEMTVECGNYRLWLYQIDPGERKFRPSPQTAWVWPSLSIAVSK